MAKGYAVILLDVADPDMYIEYAKAASAIEARYGAKPIIVGDAEEVIEGLWPAQRVVLLEFPTLDDARAWYNDPDYQTLLPLRHQATSSKILFIEGFDTPTD